MILVTGFGPFPGVDDNPSAKLVRALQGRTVAGHTIEALVLDVVWGDAADAVIAQAETHQPALVLGFGVAKDRDNVCVETTAVRTCRGLDAHGDEPPGDHQGPEQRGPTLDPGALADLLGADLSDDAGTYLCNAWLYRVPAAIDAPAAFVHIPPQGLNPERVVGALEAWFA